MHSSSITIVALLCVLTFVAATTIPDVKVETVARSGSDRRCSTYCFLRDSRSFIESLKKRCARSLSRCRRSGKSGWACRCGGSGGGGSVGGGGTGGGGFQIPRPGPTTPQQPAVTTCNRFFLAATKKDASRRFAVAMTRTRGFFLFNWTSYVVPDKFTITQGGFKIFDSAIAVPGSGTARVDLNGFGSTIVIVVTSPTRGSIWDFFVGCGQL